MGWPEALTALAVKRTGEGTVEPAPGDVTVTQTPLTQLPHAAAGASRQRARTRTGRMNVLCLLMKTSDSGGEPQRTPLPRQAPPPESQWRRQRYRIVCISCAAKEILSPR